MILYHGSPHKLETLRARQATAGEGINVPEGELLNAIYLTPDRGFAIAMAARPEGMTNMDDTTRTIEFEHPEMFDHEKEIYLYAIDTNNLPEGSLHEIDERQIAIIDVPEIKPTSTEVLPASAVEQYYELRNWKKAETQEPKPEERRRSW